MTHKILLAIKSIRNLPVLLMDFFGFLKGDVVYYLWNGNTFIARAGTTDYAEIIINNADSEYPSTFFPSNQSPIILDVGANIGETSLFIYKKLFDINPTIYALEPNPYNFPYLLKNIKINKANNIKPFRIALTGKSGIASLNFNGLNYDGGFIKGVGNKTWSKSEKVLTTSLEDFCRENLIENIDLLKMDIEGSEYTVFNSSLDFIKAHVKSIFVELHNLDKKNNYKIFKKKITKQGFALEADIMNRTLFLRNTDYQN